MDGSTKIADTIIKQIPAGIAVLSVNTSISVKNANDEFFRIIGYRDEQDFMINNGEDIMSLISEEDYERLLMRFSMTGADDEVYEYKLRVKKADGEYIWALLKYKFLEHTNETNLFQIHMEDVTKRHEMEIELDSVSARYAEHRAEEFVFRYSAKKDMLTVPMKNILGQEQETVMEHFLSTKRWAEFVVQEDKERVEEALSKILFLPNTGEITFRYRKNPIGAQEIYKVYYKNNASKSMRAQWVMGRIVNITQERESELEVANSIKHDSITGFYNYRNFVDNVKEAMEQENVKKSSIIVLCINNLNVINNTFGSMFADTVIQNVSRKLLTLIRESDICGRLNQDSFAIWIKNVDSEIVYSKAKELCNSVSNVYSGERKNLNILSCAGISGGEREMSFEEMFQRAYSAMSYARKQENKCTATYRDNMPMVNMGSERFEKELYYRIENYDVDMLSFAFGLLVNSRDIASSINLLLARIGERYDLDDIVISSMDHSTDSQTIINWWSKTYGIREVTPLQDPIHRMLMDISGRIDKKGMFIFNDGEYDEMSETFRNSGYHIASMVGNAYYFDNRFAGFVGFIDEHNHRDWSDYVKGTFYEMVNILTVFLAINADKDADLKKINELSDIDRLTGLLNVDAFKDRAQQLSDSLEPDDMLVMVFTDINNFAYINDTYGQTAGDSLLRDFGEFLSKRDNISCRIYSDFFMTLGVSKPGNLQFNHIKGANKKFEKMTKKKFPLSNIKLSTGIFMFRPEDCDIDTAMDNANMARKACKQAGDLGVVVYDDKMRKTREKEQRFIGGLQSAIANGEFRLFLQPKFRLDTKEVIGAEALSRWVTNDGVTHFPDEFIPMFEKQGQIVQVDFFIYEQVLSLMKRWKGDGKKLIPVSVNFSRLNVHHDNFVDELDKLAQYYGIKPELIEIEITESAISTNDDDMIKVLAELRDHGFVVDMDDFGTGMSSLNMLLNAPVDIVKVDKSFLYNSLEKKNKKYIEYVAGLISAADKEVIFEGVENEEQAKFLMECGYYNAQGFLFDTPIEAGEFEKKYIYG